ncbi:MAG: hypothetical protein Q7U75_10075, partial [Desulfobacterales bacterium]|nr:hypothetical protein [Desulfobacterales bacterium]
KLIGSLVVRGPDAVPETLVLQPWATVTGRLVDENGQALTHKDANGTWRGPLTISSGGSATVIDSDPEVGVGIGAKTDAEGRFRIDRLIPGQRYSARIYLGQGRLSATAFENLILGAGELRDLGDLRLNLSTDAKSPTEGQN